MSDLRALLVRAAGDPPDLPDVDMILERGNALRARRRLRWAVGAGVASALLVGVLSVGQPGLDRLLVPAGPAPKPTTEPLVTNSCPASGITDPGDLAYTLTRPGLSSALQVMPAGGGTGRCLVDTPGSDSWPAWSPDGRWIAFVGGDGIRDDVFVVRSDGTDLTRVTDTPEGEAGPVWSPDGRRLAYTVGGGEGRAAAVHVIGRDGGSDEVVLRGPDVGMIEVQDWSPDGRTLLFTRDVSAEGGHIALWAMAPDGTGQRLLRTGPGDLGSAARFSPDGSQVAFQADVDGGCIYRSDALLQRLTRITTGCSKGGSLSWSPDGTRLALAAGNDGPGDLVVVDVDGAGRRAVTSGSDVTHVDWRPRKD